MSVNDEEKINYIKNYFHPYYDIELDSNIFTETGVNIVIPLDNLKNVDLYSNDKYYHNISFSDYKDKRNVQILDSYNDSSIQKDALCTLYKVIDGDTLELKFTEAQYNNLSLTAYKNKKGQQIYPFDYTDENEDEYIIDRIRLVGVNTPEINDAGGEDSKKFLEKICSKENKPAGSTDTYLDGVLSIKIDSSNPRDKYGRALAVLFVDYGTNKHKNINEVLLKEGLAEIMYIPPSDFTPSDWAGPKTQTSTYHKMSDSICKMFEYLNTDLSNLVFTPDNDLETIYNYEIYKDILFLKANPYSSKIRMHIMPKSYDCMNSLLLFKDEFIENLSYQSGDYRYDKKGNPINCLFQTSEGDRDRTNPNLESNYKFDKFTNKDHFYQIITQQFNQASSGKSYAEEDYRNSFCEFEYDISKNTRGLNNLQINAGYHYNQSTPYYAVHYTGVKDKTNHISKKTLIDANFDNIFSDKPSNNIIEFNESFPENIGALSIRKYDSNMDIDHLDLTKTYHKTLKYINGDLYVEEEGKYISETWEAEE